VKLLLDENLSPLHGRTLRALGIDSALRWAVPHLSGTDLKGKLVIVDDRKIRIRG
jgi:hypothetical protein